MVVIGSRNSAAEAALDLYRHGAHVTLVARAPAISERVKYWIKPDLENRIRAGKIRALFNGRFAASMDDIRAVALPSLRHRVLLNFEGEAEGVKTDAILGEILKSLPETTK